MKIKWNGHACFTITSNNGTTIITDPYNSKGYGDELTYEIVRERADGVLVSHDHMDHNYVKALAGSPKVLKDSGNIKGIDVSAFKTFHDESGGSKRGMNTVFKFAVDDISICFTGDLGHILSQEQLKAIRPVDVLLIPVGGTYTLDPDSAAELVNMLKPLIAIPMHYKTSKCDFPIKGVDVFASKMPRVINQGKTEIEITKENLPAYGPVVWILEHAY